VKLNHHKSELIAQLCRTYLCSNVNAKLFKLFPLLHDLVKKLQIYKEDITFSTAIVHNAYTKVENIAY